MSEQLNAYELSTILTPMVYTPTEASRVFQPNNTAETPVSRRSGDSQDCSDGLDAVDFRPRWWPGEALLED